VGDCCAPYCGLSTTEKTYYYNDLVSEIKLNVHVDGPDVVGTAPFGVFVDIEHTRGIERELGGFRRYLQNQNSGRNNYYNYGRPTQRPTTM
jgi:hypothetical protein